MKKQSNNQNSSQNEQSEQMQDDQREEQENYDRLKTKQLPATIMLLGGAVAVIVTYVRGFSLRETLVVLLVSLLIFYILGLVLKRIFDSFHIKQKDSEEGNSMEEGEVIEKDPEEDTGTDKKNKK